MQGLLVAGAVEWLVIFRQTQGLPWQRLAAILGRITVCTLLSALVFTTSRLKARYNLPKKTQAKK